MKRNITIRHKLPEDPYHNDVSRHLLLTVEEEVMLINSFQEGYEDALKRLSEANRRFVVSVAKQYQGRGKTLEELIEFGNKGLELAARKFDPKRGFKFISYAVWFIRACILTSLEAAKPNMTPAELTAEEKYDIVSKSRNEREKEILARWLGLDILLLIDMTNNNN